MKPRQPKEKKVNIESAPAQEPLQQEPNKEDTVTMNLLVNPENMITKGVDSINLNYSADGIVMNLLQKQFPQESPESQNSILIARYTMTWPHFARAARLFTRILAENREKAKANLIKELFPEEDK